MIKTGCTTLAVVPPATNDGQVYLSWNMDILYLAKLFLDRFKLFVIPNVPYSYLGFGIPGFTGLGLMNETGLSVVVNAVGMMDGIPRGKLGWIILADLIKKSSNVEEVAEYFEKIPRMIIPGYNISIFMNLNSIWADASGNAAVIEYSSNHLAVKFIEETGYLVETNHHQFLDRHKSRSNDPTRQEALMGSYARLGRAWELARKWKGQFNLKKVMDFNADHGLNYSLLEDFGIYTNEIIDDATICCHYWNYHKYIKENKLFKAFNAVAEGKTLMSFILEPIKKRLHWCPGHPCQYPYRSYDLVKAFKKANEIKQTKKLKAFKDPLNILNRPFIKHLLYWTFYSLDRLIPI